LIILKPVEVVEGQVQQPGQASFLLIVRKQEQQQGQGSQALAG